MAVRFANIYDQFSPRGMARHYLQNASYAFMRDIMIGLAAEAVNPVFKQHSYNPVVLYSWQIPLCSCRGAAILSEFGWSLTGMWMAAWHFRTEGMRESLRPCKTLQHGTEWAKPELSTSYDLQTKDSRHHSGLVSRPLQKGALPHTKSWACRNHNLSSMSFLSSS